MTNFKSRWFTFIFVAGFLSAASVDDLTFALVDGEDGFLTIDGTGDAYTVAYCRRSASGSLSIPGTYNGKPVVSIWEDAFSNCDGLTSVEIPDSITTIWNRAFYDCDGLISVEIPDAVSYMSSEVFFGCDNLVSVSIGGSLAVIPGSAFSSCTSLTSISIPNSTTSIGDSAFANCASLVSIQIPSSVNSIGERAFFGCDQLASISIPDSVRDIRNSTFALCGNLVSVLIPNSVSTIGERAFYNCDSLENLMIPNSVVSIGYRAFFDCDSIERIIIPSSVNSLGESEFGGDESGEVFYNCDSLVSATFEGDAPMVFGDEVFANASNTFVVSFYDGATGFSLPTWRGYPSQSLQVPVSPVLSLLRFYESEAGQSAAIDATPTSGQPQVYSYQWYLNNFAIPSNFGGTGSTYTINGVESNEGTWRVEVTNDAGTTSSTFEYLIIADDDSDGISNGREAYETLTDPNLADTDGDGLDDGDELNVHSTDPLDVDSDDDSIMDGIEVNHQSYGFDPAVDSTAALTAFHSAAKDLPNVLTQEQFGKLLSLGGVELSSDTGNSLSLDFVVEVSDDLEGWTEIDSLNYPVAPSDSKMFMRVRKP